MKAFRHSNQIWPVSSSNNFKTIKINLSNKSHQLHRKYFENGIDSSPFEYTIKNLNCLFRCFLFKFHQKFLKKHRLFWMFCYCSATHNSFIYLHFVIHWWNKTNCIFMWIEWVDGKHACEHKSNIFLTSIVKEPINYLNKSNFTWKFSQKNENIYCVYALTGECFFPFSQFVLSYS